MLLFSPFGRLNRHSNIFPVGRGIHQLEGEGLKPLNLEEVVKFEAQGAHIAVAGDLKVDIVLLPGAWVLRELHRLPKERGISLPCLLVHQPATGDE